MRRACDLLVSCASKRIRPTMVWVPIPVLLPGERTSTEDQPAKGLYAQLPAMNSRAGVLDASLLVGYVWADEPRATASAVLTGTDPTVLEEEAARLGREYWNAREDFKFGVPVGSIAELIDQAQRLTTQPVILADSGDNPTGGGVGDRAEVLEELLSRGFKNALVAGIADLPATELCYQHAPGTRLPLRIGAYARSPGQPTDRGRGGDSLSACRRKSSRAPGRCQDRRSDRCSHRRPLPLPRHQGLHRLAIAHPQTSNCWW